MNIEEKKADFMRRFKASRARCQCPQAFAYKG